VKVGHIADILENVVFLFVLPQMYRWFVLLKHQ